MDTYAWVEYLNGSSKGLKVKRLLDDEKNSFVTLESNLAELRYWCLKKRFNFNEAFSIINLHSNVQPLILHDWLNAAFIKNNKKDTGIGMLDCLILAKQSSLNCFVVTGDIHFKNSKNIVLI